MSGGEQEHPMGKVTEEPTSNIGKTGWSAIEDYAYKHDANSMKVFSEAIDTLLVFAGLFSAVLTAFVVPAYGMLQPDNSMLLLSGMSSQLSSLTKAVSLFVSSEVPPDLPPSAAPSLAFSVSSFARWINVLWFLSLIFSLASALFGILSKQWIREYLQWNQTTAAPRENILVRQLRIEAWEKWKVPAGIAAIPALLELAVVLFIVGLVILLWTLDTIVAIVISVAAGILLSISSTVTVLPAFFQGCPYKSPTGWACVFVYDTLVGFQDTFGEALTHFQSWRERDLSNNGSISTEISDLADDSLISNPSQPVDDSQPIEDSGWVNNSPWEDDLRRFNEPWRREDPRRMELATRRAEIVNTTAQFTPLIRALVWVRQGSEDARLREEVVRCMYALPSWKAWDLQWYGSSYALWKLWLVDGGMDWQPFDSLLDASIHYTGCQTMNGYTVDVGSSQSGKWVLSNLIGADIQADFIGEHRSVSTMQKLDANRSAERLVVHVVLLSSLGRLLRSHNDAEAADDLCGRLIRTYNQISTSSNPLYLRGMHTMLLEAACSLGRVCIAQEAKELSDLGSHTIRWAFGAQSLREFFAILDQFAFIDTVTTVREPRHTDLQDGYAMPVIIGARDLRYTDLQDGYGRLMPVITGDRVGEHYMKLRFSVLSFLNKPDGRDPGNLGSFPASPNRFRVPGRSRRPDSRPMGPRSPRGPCGRRLPVLPYRNIVSSDRSVGGQYDITLCGSEQWRTEQLRRAGGQDSGFVTLIQSGPMTMGYPEIVVTAADDV
ncbi:hypothetical protein PHLCEN_2v4097 [Hermanssonia centrifuga]|uniref:DUF6535 domain-containing protein n=1 Tax=Hermanssonia centrifuga TaxID=98765 RepID=A0A2R6Q2A0_9APHY|nr:hypothetical protein PHLCEN_2v4097 [Hermanssonia centrifuga]